MMPIWFAYGILAFCIVLFISVVVNWTLDLLLWNERRTSKQRSKDGK